MPSAIDLTAISRNYRLLMLPERDVAGDNFPYIRDWSSPSGKGGSSLKFGAGTTKAGVLNASAGYVRILSHASNNNQLSMEKYQRINWLLEQGDHLIIAMQ